jgi:stress response protein YsnF
VISAEQLAQVIGCKVVSSDGSEIGKVSHVYCDNATNRPEWATVRIDTGMLGTGAIENFVPLTEADFHEGVLWLPYDIDRVKDAPGIDGEDEPSSQQEVQLYRYYGLSSPASRQPDAGHDTGDTDTDEAMTRSGERVRAAAETHESGRIRLRKYVVTKDEQITISVSHEEVQVECEPITGANRDADLSGPELSEEEHEVITAEERPVVQKETVPVERVRLATAQERVDVPVREERLEADVDDAGFEQH